MHFYRKHVLPRLTHLAVRQEQLRRYRERVVSAARGRVLEIGIGSGLNLPRAQAGWLLSFVEHGLAPEERVRRWQRRLTPVWCRCAGNCHLDRPTAPLVERSGFRLERIETGYARGPKPMTFMYEGMARRG